MSNPTEITAKIANLSPAATAAQTATLQAAAKALATGVQNHGNDHNANAPGSEFNAAQQAIIDKAVADTGLSASVVAAVLK